MGKSNVKSKEISECHELIFYKKIPRPHIMSQNKVRLTDEAASIIESIYLETNIPLTQIASEMIKFAYEYTRIEQKAGRSEIDEY